MVGEPAAQLGVVGLVVLGDLLPESLEFLKAQLLQAHGGLYSLRRTVGETSRALASFQMTSTEA